MKANVVLTLVELTGLLIVIFIGLWRSARARATSRAQFNAGSDAMFIWPVITATTLAFFAMVGFEDSVNMAEETKDPTRTFPKILLIGLFIAVIPGRSRPSARSHASSTRDGSIPESCNAGFPTHPRWFR